MRKAEQATAGVPGGFAELFAGLTTKRGGRRGFIQTVWFQGKPGGSASATGVQACAVPGFAVAATPQTTTLQGIFAAAGEHAAIAGAASITRKSGEWLVAAAGVLFGRAASERSQGSAAPDSESPLSGVNWTNKAGRGAGGRQGLTSTAGVGRAAGAHDICPVAGPRSTAAIAGLSQGSGVSGTPPAGVLVIALTDKSRRSALPDARAACPARLPDSRAVPRLTFGGAGVNFREGHTLIFDT